ncbi:hypothetical protein LTR17_021223 [Elasticomyces elasticus]|nr:hypothetical protein LTR17_021223 [Elasticomyces elasticus]
MQAVGVNGKAYGQGVGIYMPGDDSFQSDVTSDSMACNVIPVKAGDTVTGSWLHTLTSTGPDESADNKVIDSSHKGPVMAYMKKVADATQNPSAGPGDGWFKISELGLISSTEWGVDALISAGGVQNVTIPECIEDGQYLLRFEVIALHSASVEKDAQFYMECAQISVSGGSGAGTPETHAIPGIYSATDPGIKVNIYNNQGQPYPLSGTYAIPGKLAPWSSQRRPKVFTCGASTANNAQVTSSNVASSVAPSTSATSTIRSTAENAQTTSSKVASSIAPASTATSTTPATPAAPVVTSPPITPSLSHSSTFGSLAFPSISSNSTRPYGTLGTATGASTFVMRHRPSHTHHYWVSKTCNED